MGGDFFSLDFELIQGISKSICTCLFNCGKPVFFFPVSYISIQQVEHLKIINGWPFDCDSVRYFVPLISICCNTRFFFYFSTYFFSLSRTVSYSVIPNELPA